MISMQKAVSVLSNNSKRKPSRVKVKEHRERLRSKGFRPIQIWVPDVRTSSFRSEAHRQSQAAASSIGSAREQAFVDALADPTGV